MMLQIKKAVENNIKRIRNAIVGIITSSKKNNTVFVKTSNDEELRDVKIISPYGLGYLPLNGNNGQVIFNNTSKKASLIGIEQEDMPVELNPGEVVLYCNNGAYIHLKDNKLYINGEIIMGNGNRNIARVNDTIEVSIDGKIYQGKITSGSSKIKL